MKIYISKKLKTPMFPAPFLFRDKPQNYIRNINSSPKLSSIETTSNNNLTENQPLVYFLQIQQITNIFNRKYTPNLTL